MKKNKTLLMKELKDYAQRTLHTQQMEKEEIKETFREFWKTNPTEREFGEAISGLLAFPEMIYIMIKEGD